MISKKDIIPFMKSIYFDYAATTPCDPAVIEAMTPYFSEQFGNALSLHSFGRRARKATESAREELAAFLGAQPAEIVFTCGATEANNMAIRGVAQTLAQKGKHIIVSAIEHHSVLEPVKQLKNQGYEITYVMPNGQGRIDPQAIAAALRSDTVLVAVGHANNEIGTVQDIAAIGQITRAHGVYFLVDAVQSVGHIPVSVKELQCDFLTLSAHKFYGPQGIGALYLRKGTSCSPILLGGDQERNRRAGTHNVPGIVGLGVAAKLCSARRATEAINQSKWRDGIIDFVINNIPGARVNGDLSNRLPNNAHFSFENIDGEAMVAALDLAGIAASVGSACSSGQLQPSHVLKAIGLSDRLALGSLRLSLGCWTTQEEINYLLRQLKEKTVSLRRI